MTDVSEDGLQWRIPFASPPRMGFPSPSDSTLCGLDWPKAVIAWCSAGVCPLLWVTQNWVSRQFLRIQEAG